MQKIKSFIFLFFLFSLQLTAKTKRASRLKRAKSHLTKNKEKRKVQRKRNDQKDNTFVIKLILIASIIGAFVYVYVNKQPKISSKQPADWKKKKPKDFKADLDIDIIGNDAVKNSFAVNLYIQAMKIRLPDVELPVNHMLFKGDSGTGKTATAKSGAKSLGIDTYIVNSACLSKTGYVGETVHESIGYAVKQTHPNLKPGDSPTLLVILDESDKLATRKDQYGRDINGLGVQQELLKVMEPNGVITYEYNRIMQKSITFSTKNIMFVLIGVFSDTAPVNNPDGQNTNVNHAVNHDSLHKEIRDCGFTKEFVARVPGMVEFEKPSPENLLKIARKMITPYENYFKHNSIKLSIEDEALGYLVQQAQGYGLQARGIPILLHKVLLEEMYHLNRENVTITKAYAERVLEPNPSNHDPDLF